MSSNNTYSLTVNASTSHLAEVRKFVAEHASRFGFSDKEIADIRLAVDEACTNIIKHAYKYDEKQNVLIKLGYSDDRLCISLTDHGKSFNPETYSKPDLREQMKQRKRGGVGVYLIRELMDKVEYHSKNNKNIIRMYKNRV